MFMNVLNSRHESTQHTNLREYTRYPLLERKTTTSMYDCSLVCHLSAVIRCRDLAFQKQNKFQSGVKVRSVDLSALAGRYL